MWPKRAKGKQKVAEDIKDIPDYERTKEKKHEMQKFINESGYTAAPGYAY